jgi:excisionase family DNA binding protein
MIHTLVPSMEETPTGESDLLTFKEAMAYLRVSRSTLNRLMWSGQITGHKVGKTWRFYRDDVRAVVRRSAGATTSVCTGGEPQQRREVYV